MEYQGKMLELVKILLKILALGLPEEWGCPPDVFDALAVNPSMPMRLLHYAPNPTYNDTCFGGKTFPHYRSLERLKCASDSFVLTFLSLLSWRPYRLRLHHRSASGAKQRRPAGLVSPN